MTKIVENEASRINDSQGYAYGCNPKTVKIRIEKVNFEVSTVREGGLYHCAGGCSCRHFDWAKAIIELDLCKADQLVKQIVVGKSGEFSFQTRRPMLSALNTDKLACTLGLKLLP